MDKIKFSHITFIQGQNGGKYPFCNSLLIDDREKVVIDPGSDEKLLKRFDMEKGNDYETPESPDKKESREQKRKQVSFIVALVPVATVT